MGRIAALALLVLAGCESARPEGRCIGINDTPEPGITYEYSDTNIIVGAIFVETVFVPVIVVLKELRCPVRKAAQR